MRNRLPVSLEHKAAMQVSRVSIGKKRLVYVIVAQKPLRYPWGRSRIAYIGTTKKGLARIASSAARRAEDVLGLWGVKEFHVRILTCAPRPNVKTWIRLERALLLVFREKYGDVPMCNKIGKRIRPDDAFDYFRRERLVKLIEVLA